MSEPNKPVGRVLIIAGSDSGGGAGIQADIKTVTALGAYAATAVTAVTIQNTQGVEGVVEVPPEAIAEQIRVVGQDIGADAIKIGMLHRTDVIAAVVGAVDAYLPDVPIVVDPVMVAKGGARLLDTEALGALKADIMLRATVATPNIPEAEMLTGARILDIDGMRHVCAMLATLGCESVLLKGGHMPGQLVHDALLYNDTVEMFTHRRIDTPHTHGTGCTLSSAIATGLAQGMDIRSAVVRARAYVVEAILAAPGFGHGHGPLGHGFTVRPFTTDGIETG